MAHLIEAPTARRPRILVAEDDDEVRWLLLERLERAGFRVAEAEDGFELEDYLEWSCRRAPDRLRPAGVVADAQMPGPSGIDVLRAARRWGLACPWVLVSASADDALRDAARALGPSHVLRRPFDFAALIALLGNLMGPGSA